VSTFFFDSPFPLAFFFSIFFSFGFATIAEQQNDTFDREHDEDDPLADWRREMRERRAVALMQAYVRGFLERKRLGLLKTPSRPLFRKDAVTSLRVVTLDDFSEPSLWGKNVMFELVGDDVKLTSATDIKLVEFLFSPFYSEDTFSVDILSTFEVWMQSFFLFFFLSIFLPDTLSICVGFDGSPNIYRHYHGEI
jgi:hypothetical protein